MSGKLVYLAGVFLLLFIVSGCINEDVVTTPEPTGGQCLEPKRMVGEICCYDENANDICDIDEIGCPDSCDDANDCTNDSCSPETNYECEHVFTYPCCGNEKCDHIEDINNECPEDCVVLEVTDFELVNEKAFVDDGVYQFIHTVAVSPLKFFRFNMTAGDGGIDEIRYTFTCNSTQHGNLDSINSEAYNETDEIDEKLNRLETTDYIVYTNFFSKRGASFSRDIDELKEGDSAYFNFKIEKKNPLKRDDLTCLVKMYFIQPKKIIYKWLKLSYI